jgi:hypothetical protein
MLYNSFIYDFYDHPIYDDQWRQGISPVGGGYEPEFGGGDLSRLKGQFIHARVRGMGWVIAQVLNYRGRSQLLELNIYLGGVPQYMLVNTRDISTLIPLGYQPPPELLGSMGSQGGGTEPQGGGMQPQNGGYDPQYGGF